MVISEVELDVLYHFLFRKMAVNRPPVIQPVTSNYHSQQVYLK